MKHYHVLAGRHGYLPDYNSVAVTKKAAISGLAWYANNIRDDCEGHTGRCWEGRLAEGYIEFNGGHGVEYAEIQSCAEWDCTEDAE